MKKKLTMVGMIMGIVVTVFGVYCMISSCNYSGSYTQYASFGGDFYTYSYEATMNAANNVQSLGHVFEEAANVLMKGIGMLLIAIGAFEFIYFADKNMVLKEETLKVEKSETIISEEVSKVLSNSEEFVKNADEE